MSGERRRCTAVLQPYGGVAPQCYSLTAALHRCATALRRRCTAVLQPYGGVAPLCYSLTAALHRSATALRRRCTAVLQPYGGVAPLCYSHKAMTCCNITRTTFTVTAFFPINFSERSSQNVHSYIRCVNRIFLNVALRYESVTHPYRSLPINPS